MTPDEHATEADRLLGLVKDSNAIDLPIATWLDLLTQMAHVHALLASRPTTVEFEGKRRCHQCDFEHPESDMVLARDGRRWTCADCVGELLDEAEQLAKLRQGAVTLAAHEVVRAERDAFRGVLADHGLLAEARRSVPSEAVPVPSTGEDQSKPENCERCGHLKTEHAFPYDIECDAEGCICGAFEPVPDEGSETDGGRPVPLSGWPYDDGSRD